MLILEVALTTGRHALQSIRGSTSVAKVTPLHLIISHLPTATPSCRGDIASDSEDAGERLNGHRAICYALTVNLIPRLTNVSAGISSKLQIYITEG